jgi:DNA-binding transcriptional regulator YiaG
MEGGNMIDTFAGKKLGELIDKFKLPRNKIAILLGTNRGTLKSWTDGGISPSGEHLESLKVLLEVIEKCEEGTKEVVEKRLYAIDYGEEEYE